jgi:hypothetical protein
MLEGWSIQIRPCHSSVLDEESGYDLHVVLVRTFRTDSNFHLSYLAAESRTLSAALTASERQAHDFRDEVL